MKIKDLKKLIEKYDDEKEIVVKGLSGITWEIDERQLAKEILMGDEKREVCKLYIR